MKLAPCAAALAVSTLALHGVSNASTLSTTTGTPPSTPRDADHSRSLSYSVDQSDCLGLPRNTLLASCPAPCLPDSPCIVYDQNPEHSQLTGCDYNTAGSSTFCWSKPTQTCEFQCLGQHFVAEAFAFELRLPNIMSPKELVPRAPADPQLLEASGSSFQSPEFVFSIGKLVLSENITEVTLENDFNTKQSLGRSNLHVDPGVLSLAPGVTSFSLSSFQVGNDHIAAIVASLPPPMKKLELLNMNLTVLSWTTFTSLPSLETLKLTYSSIPLISGANVTLPALIKLTINTCKLTGFALQAPKLNQLSLEDNKLVRIPESVFTYSQLKYLYLARNPIYRPLVLTAQQLQFLEGLSTLTLSLVDPPDQKIVTQLPSIEDANYNYGDYTDSVNISTLLEGATQTVLRKNRLLPVLVVDSEKAATYNNLLELRARYWTTPKENPTAREVSCLDLPRNTLLASCPAPCQTDSPCIVYDQDAPHTKLTGCDYGTASGRPSTESFCWSKPLQTCEFHCFQKIEPGVLRFRVSSNDSNSSAIVPRTAQDPSQFAKPLGSIDFYSNSFVSSIGRMNLSAAVTSVDIMASPSANQTINMTVNPAMLANAPSVKSLSLWGIPLGIERVAAIISSGPSKLKELSLTKANITALPFTTFAPVQSLEKLYISHNRISTIAGGNASMPALITLDLLNNIITGFELQAPKLIKLNLQINKLVRIPDSVFTYSQLEFLDLRQNPLFRPLVLTAGQLQFLESLPQLFIDRLMDPPDQGIVSRLPATGENQYGNYTDSVDISVLLEGSTQTFLRKDPLLPVRIVDSENAATYNKVLEMRARFRGIASSADPLRDWQGRYVPENACEGVQRNALLSNCAAKTCPINGACVVYDQLADLSLPSGCDYDVASTQSACLPTKNGNCEVQCFGAYAAQSQFKFVIPYRSELGQKTPRHVDDEAMATWKTAEIPFLSNTFVNKVGQLNLTPTITDVLIAGGQIEQATQGRFADVVVSSNLLRKTPSVTSLSLLNMDLTKSDLPAILASSSAALKLLNLRNTKLATLPEGTFANMKQLSTLILAQNDLTTLDMKAATLPNLQTLDLSENALTTVTIATPSLRTLNLRANNLVHIPPSVFSLQALNTLNLDGNPFAPLVMTQAEAAFLNSVTNLRLPQRPITKSLKNPTVPADSTSSTTPTDSLTGSTLSSREDTDMADTASLLASGGKVTVVGGIEVIIVSEQVAKQYNDRLEQKQKESAPTPRSRAREESEASSTLTATTPASGSQQDVSSPVSVSSGRQIETADSESSVVGSNSSSIKEKNATPASTERASTASETNSTSLMTVLVLVSVGSGFCVAVAALFIASGRNRKTVVTKAVVYDAMDDGIEESSVHATLASQLASGGIYLWWNDDTLLSHRLDAGRISDERVIGSDDLGVTWLVNYKVGSRKLVSKRVIQGEGPAYDAKVLQLVAEAKIASTLRYASIVRFVGVAWTDNTDLQVLYEYMNQGDLGSYLARTTPSSLPWVPEKLQLAIDTIEAVVFTHCFDPPLLHRNIKASSVLLDGNGKAKLGDFGCVRAESATSTMTSSGVGSGRWLAPEILSGSTSYGTPSDIYSFGVLLCELDTHQVPYADVAEQMPEVALLQCVGRGEMRPSLSASCPLEIRELAESCLAFHPEDRPSAMEVAHRLRSIRRRAGASKAT